MMVSTATRVFVYADTYRGAKSGNANIRSGVSSFYCLSRAYPNVWSLIDVHWDHGFSTKGFQGNYYMWGVFRGRRNKSSSAVIQDVRVLNISNNHMPEGNKVNSGKDMLTRVKSVDSMSPQVVYILLADRGKRSATTKKGGRFLLLSKWNKDVMLLFLVHDTETERVRSVKAEVKGAYIAQSLFGVQMCT
ncbi:hypothetical protein Tco_0309227 [Tanacetum coccineum]